MVISENIRPARPKPASPDDLGPQDYERCDSTNRIVVSRPKAPTNVGAQLTTADSAPDVLHRCQQYRKAFPWAGITCPGGVLRRPESAAEVKKRGHAVDVRSADELDVALSAGIPATRIVVHDDGDTAAPIRRAVNADVGRLVLACCQQVKVLASCARRPPRVLVDITTNCADDAVTAIFARRRLNLIGLHARLAPATHPTAYADTVAEMIAQMARIRREQDIILTRVSLAGGCVLSDTRATTGDLRALGGQLEDAFDNACARFRFPRPALILAPS